MEVIYSTYDCYTMYSVYVLMVNWIEILAYVWAFSMSIILGSYILCG